MREQEEAQLLHDGIRWLRDLERDRARPDEALARLSRLSRRHPKTSIEVVWEEEAYDGSWHYDLLLGLSGDGTASLSYSSDQGLPWPLRGVHRWSEQDVLRVGSTVWQVQEVLAHLDFLWQEGALLDGLIDACLIEEVLRQDPIEISDSDLQEEMDAFRLDRGLHLARETHAWMEGHGITQPQMEAYLVGQLRFAQLQERETKDRVEAYFEVHRASFDRASVAALISGDRAKAEELGASLREGGGDFWQAAEGRFLSQTGEGKGSFTPALRVIRRGELAQSAATSVFTAQPGATLGPLEVGNEYWVLRLLSVSPATLDPQTRDQIQARLFKEWLTARRKEIPVEWYWGTVATTAEGSLVEG